VKPKLKPSSQALVSSQLQSCVGQFFFVFATRGCANYKSLVNHGFN